MKRYILQGTRVVEHKGSLKDWASVVCDIKNRRVALAENICGYRISTVFMITYYEYIRGKPLFFETMVFDISTDKAVDKYTRHWATWKEAALGHYKVIKKVLGEHSFTIEKEQSSKKRKIKIRYEEKKNSNP